MVTRQFPATAQDIQNLTREIRGMRAPIVGNILPVLGLSAGLGILSGSMLSATQGGLELSSAGYGLTTSLYGLQDLVARLLTPVIEAITPVLSDAIDWFLEWNEANANYPAYGLAAAGAAWALYRPLRALSRLVFSPAMLAVLGVAGAGGLGVIAHGAATGNLEPARAVDRALGLQEGQDPETGEPTGIGTQIQRALPWFNQTQPVIGGLFENAAIFWRDAGEAVLQDTVVPIREGAEELRQGVLDLGQMLQGVGLPRVGPQGSPQPTSSTTNNFYITSHDDNEMLRRIQGYIDQGALQTYGDTP